MSCFQFCRFILKKKPDSRLNDTDFEGVVEKAEVDDTSKSNSFENTDRGNASQSVSSKRKKKARGQNKKRPRTVPLQKQHERLCPSLSMGSSNCDNKECKYFHDIQEFMKNKPKDIGDQCVNFTLTGKCIYGLECRFATCHLSSDFKNIIDMGKYESTAKSQHQKSGLCRDLQVRLRKKQYPFPITEEYLPKLVSSQTSTGACTTAQAESRVGFASDEDIVKLNVREKKKVS